MADSSPSESTPKRVLPARERRESFKLQASSLPKPSATPQPTPALPSPATAVIQTPTTNDEPRVKRKYVRRAPLKSQLAALAQRRNSTPGSEDVLPTRLPPSKPLPLSRTKPEYQTTVKEYQSIAESAILASSLYRSRLQWLCDGIFERYWRKPSKKKGAAETTPNNPDQKSMQRLGNCIITIEPHVFDAVVYTVREPQPSVLSYARHPNQYPPKTSPSQPHSTYFVAAPGLTPPMHPPVGYSPSISPQVHPPPPPPPPTTQSHPVPQPVQPPPAKKIKQENVISSTPTQRVDEVSISSQQSQSNSTPASAPSSAPKVAASKPPPPKANADPVIQMLASRAASDPRLKDLMKVVATSKATQEQLKEFQAHIDEFNAVIKREQAQRERQQSTQSALPPLTDGAGDRKYQPRINNPAPVYIPAATHPATYAPSNVSPHPTNMPMHAPHYASYPPIPRPEALIKHIVLELTSPASSSQPVSQDRWLFPEYAVLDTPHSGRGLEMVCSFLVERKGSQLSHLNTKTEEDDSEPSSKEVKWKPDVEYYQPVTMTLRAPHHRTLETIARAAKPLPQVHAYMAEVMKKTRAPEEYLVLQLPVEDKVDGDVPMNDFTDSAVELSPDEDDELKEYYGN